MPEYLSLKRGVRPIKQDGFNSLFDNKTASEFHLDDDQLDLIYQLDGSRTLDEILAGFEEESRENVNAFLSNLTELGYLERKSSRSKRQLPKHHVSPYLEGVFFDITSQCNLWCNHCYVSEYHREGKGQDLSFAEIMKILDDLALMNVRDLTITGGEPTLRSDIIQIFREIADRDLRISAFFTNGFGVKKDIAELLASLPHFIRVYISLDGINPKMHAKIRGSRIDPGLLFRSVISSIRMFIDHGIPVTINTCLHRGNVGVLPQFYDLLKSLGVSQ